MVSWFWALCNLFSFKVRKRELFPVHAFCWTCMSLCSAQALSLPGWEVLGFYYRKLFNTFCHCPLDLFSVFASGPVSSPLLSCWIHVIALLVKCAHVRLLFHCSSSLSVFRFCPLISHFSPLLHFERLLLTMDYLWTPWKISWTGPGNLRD